MVEVGDCLVSGVGPTLGQTPEYHVIVNYQDSGRLIETLGVALSVPGTTVDVVEHVQILGDITLPSISQLVLEEVNIAEAPAVVTPLSMFKIRHQRGPVVVEPRHDDLVYIKHPDILVSTSREIICKN